MCYCSQSSLGAELPGWGGLGRGDWKSLPAPGRKEGGWAGVEGLPCPAAAIAPSSGFHRRVPGGTGQQGAEWYLGTVMLCHHLSCSPTPPGCTWGPALPAVGMGGNGVFVLRKLFQGIFTWHCLAQEEAINRVGASRAQRGNTSCPASMGISGLIWALCNA